MHNQNIWFDLFYVHVGTITAIYIDSRSQIEVHTDKRTPVHSAQSFLVVTRPSSNRGRHTLTQWTCHWAMSSPQVWSFTQSDHNIGYIGSSLATRVVVIRITTQVHLNIEQYRNRTQHYMAISWIATGNSYKYYLQYLCNWFIVNNRYHSGNKYSHNSTIILTTCLSSLMQETTNTITRKQTLTKQ